MTENYSVNNGSYTTHASARKKKNLRRCSYIWLVNNLRKKVGNICQHIETELDWSKAFGNCSYLITYALVPSKMLGNST